MSDNSAQWYNRVFVLHVLDKIDKAKVFRGFGFYNTFILIRTFIAFIHSFTYTTIHMFQQYKEDFLALRANYSKLPENQWLSQLIVLARVIEQSPIRFSLGQSPTLLLTFHILCDQEPEMQIFTKAVARSFL